MPRPRQDPKHRTLRRLASASRWITKIRVSGGSYVLTLPKSLCQSFDLHGADKVLIEFNPEDQTITVTKDADSADRRNIATDRRSNLIILADYLQLLHRTPEYGDPEWCKIIERILQAQLRHLRGEKLEPITVPDEEGD